MDPAMGLPGAPGAVSVTSVDLTALSHHAGVRRLFELPAEHASDCTVRIQASAPGRCAICRARYAAGEWIGHSRDADGWVASCCI